MTLLLDILADNNFRTDDLSTKANIRAWIERDFPRAVDSMPKYRVSPEVMDMVHQLQAELHTPSSIDRACWVEFGASANGGSICFGMLLDDNMKALAFAYLPDTRTIFDFVVKTVYKPNAAVQVDSPDSIRGLPNERAIGSAVGRCYLYGLKVLTLMNHPKIVETAPSAPFDPKLQRARVKSGKRPLVDHHEVVIHVTRKEREARERAAEYEARHGVRLHRVRAHVKMQNGHLKKIDEYWRGDAALGTVKHKNYKVAL